MTSWLRRLPRPTPLQWFKASPVLVVVLAMAVLLGRNYDTVDFPHYEVPEGFTPAPPPTTQAAGSERPSLAAVGGVTTTTVPANVGTSRLNGTVSGPQGGVSGAIVRIERSISGVVQTYEVGTDAAGSWDAPGIGGGRYRVRAFLPPTLAQRSAEVFLLTAGEARRLDLVVEEFSQPSAAIAAAPSPAFLGQPVNVAVRVTGRFVDGDGFVGVQPLAGGSVEVTSAGNWTRVTPPGVLVTDGDGQVVVTFECRQPGAVQIQAVIRVTAAAPPLTVQASFDCIDPATLTTTTVPDDGTTPDPSSTSSTATTAPGGSTTSTTAPG